jgi:ankyrin repeat protein
MLTQAPSTSTVLLKSCSLDIDAQDDSLMTPLHRACVFGRLEAAETLGKLGANFGSLDSFLRTPFVVAYQYGQEALMTFCRESAPECLADPIESFQLPIWSLVRSGRVDLIAEAKSRREAEFSCREPGTDKTNFHTAILNNNDEAASVILKMLLNSSARDLLDATDFHRQTPLHLAAIRGYTECLECLVRHGAKLDEVDRFGKTALYSAFANSFYKMAVCLIDAGTTISNDCGVDLQKILFAAIEFESIDAVRKLLDAGADVLGQDEYGVTPKELARQTGNQEVIQLILTSRSAYFRDGSSRTATRTHVTEPLTDEPTVISTNMRAIPFHPFRGRFVDLDWSVVQGIEPEDESQEPLPVLC